MRFVSFAVLLCSLAPAVGQKPPDAQEKPEFRFQPPLAAPGKPQFKLQIPKQGKVFPLLPAPQIEVPPRMGMDWDVDPGIVRKPQGFAQKPGRPAPRRTLYPNLKIQPTEIALLGTGSCAEPTLKTEPIPRTFPKAKVEPIPITSDCLRMLPVETTP
jgi:hypothetical protein